MGTDKASLEVAGESMLVRTIRALGNHVTQICVVGEPAPVPAGGPVVTFTLESPRFGGPVAGLAAGVAAIAGDEVFVLPVDLATPDQVVELLVRSPLGADGAALVDEDGWPQYLAARYRKASLLARLAEVETSGLSVRRFAKPLRLNLIAATNAAVADLDSPAQVVAQFGA